MKSTASPFKKITKQFALVLPLALAFSVPAAFAQSFDTSSLAGGATVNSNGSAGSYGNSSYKTGESPGSASEHVTSNGFTTKQQGGPMGTLLLNPTGFGGLAPVFGGLTGYGSGAFNNPSGFNININGGGVSINGGIPGLNGLPGGGVNIGGLPGMPGGLNINGGLPGMPGPPGGFPGMPGPPGGFPGMPGPPGGFPGMPGSFSNPTIGGNFNVGGTNIGVSTNLNTIESGLSSIGNAFGF